MTSLIGKGFFNTHFKQFLNMYVKIKSSFFAFEFEKQNALQD